MTRKDYVAIAAALRAKREAYKGRVLFTCDDHANRIADVMAADNARFDRARFLKACGVQS